MSEHLFTLDQIRVAFFAVFHDRGDLWFGGEGDGTDEEWDEFLTLLLATPMPREVVVTHLTAEQMDADEAIVTLGGGSMPTGIVEDTNAT